VSPPSSSRPQSSTPLAIALHYEHGGVPVVVAKGQGAVAARIVETARVHDVPIDDNPVLAQALMPVPLDEPIPEALFVAVAQVIGWVMQGAGRGVPPRQP
jgi:flagellar biosynthesis protein